jgi:hypothetical protein
MSITNEVRTYADAALEQGKQVVDQAQARLTDRINTVADDATVVVEKVQDRAQGLVSKASETYGELAGLGESLYERVSTLPVVDSLSSTVEPYVAQLKGYGTVVAEKAEELFADLKKNEQFAKVLGSAELAATAVLETVNERVIKPVRSAVAPAPTHKRTAPSASGSAATHRSAENGRAPAKPAAKAPSAKAAPAKRPATRRPASKG